MYKVPLPELKQKILASGKLNSEELEQKIKQKINELSGLISEGGAAHIIANELGVDLIPKGSERLKIKEVYSGMKNVSVLGKVVRKFEAREFQKGEGKGKVCSLLLGDESGSVRVVFWNDQVDQLQDVNEEDILLVKSAYVRDNKGNKEIHLGDRGSIDINPEGETVGTVRSGNTYERKQINGLSGGETGVEIVGTVVQVFDPRYFNVDSETGKRVQEGGEVSYVMNAVIDDGTGNLRCVFWKNQTNHLLGKTEENVVGFKENLGAFEELKTDLLGEQFKLKGKVVRNEMFDRLEFSVQIVEKANPEEEMKVVEKN
ncbi:MAG: OB-fold nucleic acid binding domain-containing protein [archaeon]|nr:OB-fold nucleic acid binding domain-containing protein [archaeon]